MISKCPAVSDKVYILVQARKAIDESGYQYKKGKSRSKMFGEIESGRKRPILSHDARLLKFQEIEEEFATISKHIEIKENRVKEGISSKNYKLCDKLTEEIEELQQRRRELETQRRSLEKKSLWYERRKLRRCDSGAVHGTLSPSSSELEMSSESEIQSPTSLCRSSTTVPESPSPFDLHGQKPYGAPGDDGDTIILSDSDSSVSHATSYPVDESTHHHDFFRVNPDLSLPGSCKSVFAQTLSISSPIIYPLTPTSKASSALISMTQSPTTQPPSALVFLGQSSSALVFSGQSGHVPLTSPSLSQSGQSQAAQAPSALVFSGQSGHDPSAPPSLSQSGQSQAPSSLVFSGQPGHDPSALPSWS